MIPDWIELALLGLAAWRTWALLALDDIIARPRRYVTSRFPGVEDFLDCPFCSGFWIALGWWGAWQLWPQGTLVAAGAVSIAAIVALIERLSSDE